jgi:hypothetical protein
MVSRFFLEHLLATDQAGMRVRYLLAGQIGDDMKLAGKQRHERLWRAFNVDDVDSRDYAI